MANDESIEKMK